MEMLLPLIFCLFLYTRVLKKNVPSAAVVALPLAMAMGVASGVGPLAGLYGAIFVGFFAALLGGTPRKA